MASAIPLMVLSLLGAGLLISIWIIAADRRRYLAGFDLRNWREQYYLKALPNFLQALHDYNFTSAWPARRNAVSAAYFAYRVRPILRARRAMNRRAFLAQHFNLHAQLHILQPYLDDAFMADRMRIVTHRVMDMADTADRDRLIAFIAQAREYRAAFQESLTAYDRQIMAEVRRRDFSTLRRIHAVCLEHGFSLLSEFDSLRRWEELAGAELVQELPELPDVRALRRAHAKVFNAAPSQGEGQPDPELS